jgi:hypothetical protein
MAKILSQAGSVLMSLLSFPAAGETDVMQNGRHVPTHCEPQSRPAHHPPWGFDCALWLFGCDV